MTLHLQFEATVGDTVENVCAELCAIATRLNVNANLQFNEVKMIAGPGSNPSILVDKYRKEVGSVSKYKLVYVAATDKLRG